MKNISSDCPTPYLKESALFLHDHSAFIKHEIKLIINKIDEVNSQCDFLLNDQNEEYIDFAALYCVLEQIEKIARHWDKIEEDFITKNQILTPPTVHRLKPFD